MAIEFFTLNVDVSQIVGTRVKQARLMIETNLPKGTPIAYGSQSQIFMPGGLYALAEGLGSFQLPTKTGATNVSDWQYVITGEYSLDGVRPVKMDPIYIDAPTSTAADNLVNFVGVTSAPATFMGAAVAQITAAGQASLASTVAARDAAQSATQAAQAAATVSSQRRDQAAASALAAQSAAASATAVALGDAETVLASAIVNDGPVKDNLTATYAPSTMLKPIATPPAGFRGLVHAPPMKIRRRMGAFEVEWNLESMRPPAGVTYYVAPNGANSADGLTPETPTSVNFAVQKPDVGTIMYAPGEYFRTPHSVSPSVNYGSINHIASGAGVFLTSFERPSAITWTSHAGSIYKFTRNKPLGIYDTGVLTSWGDYSTYTEQANLAAVTGPGQWAHEGGVLYVWALGNANLADTPTGQRLRVSIDIGKGGMTRDNAIQWVEGIEFHGGVFAYHSGSGAYTNASAVLIDCKFKYSQLNAVNITGGKITIFVRCEVSSAGTDGFNYHDVLGHNIEFIEIDCHAHHVGENASTAHEATTGIRVGGQYEKAAAPVVADVNSAHTWNLGCHAGDQTIPNATDHSVSWRVNGNAEVAGKGKATMWLDECTSDGSQYAFAGILDAVIKIHAHGAANPEWLAPLGGSTDGPVFYAR